MLLMDNRIKVIAFDLDGTLTEHRTKLEIRNKEMLDKLSKKYKLLIIGAGDVNRIFQQMDNYPIDIIGNYGMQYSKYNIGNKNLDIVYDKKIPIDRVLIEKRIEYLRKKYGYINYIGDSVEYHKSGCITFPLLGTNALIKDKLVFDPDKKKRHLMYEEVKKMFFEYTTFIGGSSSFDFAPLPYNKLYALNLYTSENHIDVNEILFVGDDYTKGGNDEDVYKSEFSFQIIENYKKITNVMSKYL